MGWKQFLKPDWRKIIIFIILISGFLGCRMVSDINCVLPGLSYFPLWFGLIPYFAASPLMLIISIPAIIIAYLISCFIVWIYDNVTKKK